MQLSGFKKVLNYTKKVTEDVKYRRTVTREEVIPMVASFSIMFIVRLRLSVLSDSFVD